MGLDEVTDKDEISLGQAFQTYQYEDNNITKINNTYYIPLLYKGEVKALFKINKIKGKWQLNFGKYFANKLANLESITSKDNPLAIVLYKYKLFAINETIIEELVNMKLMSQKESNFDES